MPRRAKYKQLRSINAVTIETSFNTLLQGYKYLSVCNSSLFSIHAQNLTFLLLIFVLAMATINMTVIPQFAFGPRFPLPPKIASPSWDVKTSADLESLVTSPKGELIPRLPKSLSQERYSRYGRPDDSKLRLAYSAFVRTAVKWPLVVAIRSKTFQTKNAFSALKKPRFSKCEDVKTPGVNTPFIRNAFFHEYLSIRYDAAYRSCFTPFPFPHNGEDRHQDHKHAEEDFRHFLEQYLCQGLSLLKSIYEDRMNSHDELTQKYGRHRYNTNTNFLPYEYLSKIFRNLADPPRYPCKPRHEWDDTPGMELPSKGWVNQNPRTVDACWGQKWTRKIGYFIWDRE